MHRYQSHWSRLLLKTLDVVQKMRGGREDEGGERQKEKGKTQKERAEEMSGERQKERTEETGGERQREGTKEGDEAEAAGAVGPLVPAANGTPRPDATDAAGEEGPEVGRVLHDASGSGAWSTGSDPRSESAKQSHRGAELEELILPADPCRGDTDGGRHRGFGLHDYRR